MSMSMRKKRAIGSLVTYLMVIAAYLVCQYLLATGGMTPRCAASWCPSAYGW